MKRVAVLVAMMVCGVQVKGVDGFVFTYLPSQLEEAKRMSVDEVMVSLADLNEKIRKRRAFHRKVNFSYLLCLAYI